MQLKIIKQNYLEKIKLLLQECEFELYEINILNEYESIVLQILVENIDLNKKDIEFDFLIKANEKISIFLDSLTELTEPYILEVSSAGAEREVRDSNILKNNINQYFYLKVNNPIENISEFQATLVEEKDELFTFSFFIKGKPKKIKLKWADINFIRFAIKF
ncbi:LSm family protein [Spiroplasma taiwanense]|uniref:Ribosome maturation factor RimP n=1 Tax=Spiroplasma taiwanense CT-1 TaxID=1276220 RepID=S5MCG5_9MOLU|nr:hypothetical protein [Spiroplasma taiwanense]AGR41423.1 ribosome maturation factor RimP [Spiroplasma taiwanense CT-1]